VGEGNVIETEARSAASWPRDPVELVGYLREREFKLGTGEALRVVAFLERLRAEGNAPTNPEEAALWLAPLVCRSPQHQAILLERLRSYARLYEKSPVRLDDELTLTTASPPLAVGGTFLRRRIIRAALITLAIVIAVFVGGPYVERSWTAPASSAAVSGKSVEIPNQNRSSLQTESPWPAAILRGIPLGAVPLLVWLALERRRRARAPAITRGAYDGDVPETLGTGGALLPLFAGSELSRAAQSLRWHRRVPSQQPDAVASLRATAARGGRPVLVPGWRPRAPEYPIAVESLSGRDHVLTLARELSQRLNVENVNNTLYLFGNDLRRLRTESDSALTLGDLSARYRDDVLIIVSDGAALVDSAAGQVRAAVLNVESWRLVVVLTPIPQRRWSWRERHLAAAGILLLPATPAGIKILGDYLRTEGRLPRPALLRRPVLSGPLGTESRDSIRWHSDAPPSAAEREAVLEAIALELTPDAFELIGIVALFPELRPDLTRFAAVALSGVDGRPLVDHAGYMSIARLPWFRYGRMPDWLRLELARQLTPDQLEKARDLFARWLMPQSAFGDGFEITSEKLAKSVENSVAAGSLPRDAIFLRFCNRENLNELDLEIPEPVVKRVTPNRLWAQHRSLLIAAAASVSIVAGFAALTRVPVSYPDWRVVSILLLLGFSIGGFAAADVGGIAYAVRRRTRSETGFGQLPLLGSIVACAAASPLMILLGVAGLNDCLFLILLAVPPLAMAFGAPSRSRSVLAARPRNDIGLLVGAALSSVVLIIADFLGMMSLAAILPLLGAVHATGIGLAFAATLRRRAVGVIVPAAIAGSCIIGVCNFIAVFFWHGEAWSVFWLAPAFAFGYFGCALAFKTDRQARTDIALAVCVVGGFAPVAALGITKTGNLPDSFAYALLPMVSIIVWLSIARPELAGRWTTWLTALCASAFGYVSTILWLPHFLNGMYADEIRLPFEFILVPAAVKCITTGRFIPRELAAAYAFDPSVLWIPVLWFCSLNYQFADGIDVDFTPLYVIATVLLARRYGRRGLPLLLWGAAPLLVHFSFGRFSTTLSPGGYLASILTYAVVADRLFERDVLLLARIGLRKMSSAVKLGGVMFAIPRGWEEILIIVVAGGINLFIPLGGGVSVGGSLSFCAGLVFVILGAGGTRRAAIVFGAAVALTLLFVVADLLPALNAGAQSPLTYFIDPIEFVMLYELGRSWREGRRGRLTFFATALIINDSVRILDGGPSMGWIGMLAAFAALGTMSTIRVVRIARQMTESSAAAMLVLCLIALAPLLAGAQTREQSAKLGVAPPALQTPTPRMSPTIGQQYSKPASHPVRKQSTPHVGSLLKDFERLLQIQKLSAAKHKNAIGVSDIPAQGLAAATLPNPVWRLLATVWAGNYTSLAVHVFVLGAIGLWLGFDLERLAGERVRRLLADTTAGS
jgi:hypothetical protein